MTMPADETEKEPVVLLRGPRDWFEALDQWRETRGKVLHLGRPSRPASIRYLVCLGIAADMEAAKIVNVRLKRGRGKSGRRVTA